MDDLLARFRGGDPRALARLLTVAENASRSGRDVLASLRRDAAAAAGWVVGLTGAPGAGKSTLADAAIAVWRARGERVAVVAVDPSSPVGGGALLGDRVRMTRWAADPGVFVRSMASRGRTGGLAPAALDAVALCLAFGFDRVLLETVGVGQAEVDVIAVADTVVVALAPGQGDDIQAAKAGLMEVADVFAITKADRPEARRLAREVRDAVHLMPSLPGNWTPPVRLVAAAVTQDAPAELGAAGGVTALLDEIDAHRAHQRDGGGAAARRAARRAFEVRLRAERRLQAAVAQARAEATATDDLDAAAVALLRRAADADEPGW